MALYIGRSRGTASASLHDTEPFCKESEHLKILSQAGLLKSKRVKQWTFYERDEERIGKIKRAIIAKI